MIFILANKPHSCHQLRNLPDAICVLSQIGAATAHSIDSNKAKLTLRDSQAELRLHIEMHFNQCKLCYVNI
uniref:Uncharacterized protein n=1 Tax=Pseudoalteromonas rubra TaxID=43658 RepID=A0A0F4QUS9_9GAMM|nr:hypothetical protein TW77_05970 [Pseudoalteromonas rubra]